MGNIRHLVSVLVALMVLATVCASARDTKICVIHAVDSDDAIAGSAFPWSRRVHADLIRKLSGENVRLIVLKYLFDQPAKDSSSDAELVHAIEKAGNVILPFSGELAMSTAPLSPPALSTYQIQDQTRTTKFISYPSCAVPFDALAGVSAGLGSFDVRLQGNRVKAIPLLVRINGSLYPSLPLVIVSNIIGAPIKEMIVEDGVLLMGDRKFPMDTNGSFTPRFSAPGSRYATYTYTDILKNHYKPDDLQGSVVIIGYSGTRFPVNFVTDASPNHNGTDINADAVESLLEGLGQ